MMNKLYAILYELKATLNALNREQKATIFGIACFAVMILLTGLALFEFITIGPVLLVVICAFGIIGAIAFTIDEDNR